MRYQSDAPLPLDIRRAERIREALTNLYEANKHLPIIVEGKKDSQSLRGLGFVGEILTLHAGRKSFYEFSEEILENYGKVILLFDWDPKGESLLREVGSMLEGRWEEFTPFRDVIKILCQKDIKDVESIPRLISRLEGTIGEPRLDIVDDPALDGENNPRLKEMYKKGEIGR